MYINSEYNKEYKIQLIRKYDSFGSFNDDPYKDIRRQLRQVEYVKSASVLDQEDSEIEFDYIIKVIRIYVTKF